jgi:hypothetical protein
MDRDLSLPVMWSDGDGPPRPGRLDLSGTTIRLEGGSRDGEQDRELDLADIRRAYFGHAAGERIGGRAALVLELRSGGTLRVAGVGWPGAVRELADRLQQIAPS